jgi:hypothetical protein
MAEWKLPLDGGCRCGRVRLRVSKPPLLTMACHCTGCQRMSASAYSLSAAFPADGFEVIAGEPVIGGMHGPARHYFCGYCMSWMFTRPDGADFLVNVRATMFGDTSWYSPFMETYTSEKLAWATTPALHSYEKFPPMEAYEGLIAEFQARGPEPSA